MQRYCLKDEGPLPIPRCGRYAITRSGVVTDLKTGLVVEPTMIDNTPMHAIPIQGLKGWIPVDFLVALTYKPVFIPFFLYDQLTVERIPGGECCPEDLIWRFPAEGLHCEARPGWVYIPGYSRYLISVMWPHPVYRWDTKNLIDTHLGSDGYVNISLLRDDRRSGITSVRFHRVLATTFKHPGCRIAELTVNHKDTVRTNNQLDNLEWSTSGENVIHSREMLRTGSQTMTTTEAMQTYRESKAKLHKQRREVWERKDQTTIIKLQGRQTVIDVKDLRTGEITEVGSGRTLATLQGITPAAVTMHLRSHDPKRLLARWYVAKYPGDDWPATTLEDALASKPAYGRAVLVKDCVSGSVTEYPSGAAVVKALGLTRKQVFGSLTGKRQRVFADRIFKYKDDDSEWIR